MIGKRFAVVVCLLAAMASQGRGQAQKPQPPGVETPAPDLKPLPPEPVAGDAIYAPLAVGPDTLKTKVDGYLVVTFGPRALFSPLLSSGIAMAKPNYNYPNNWHQGMQGFGRQYGSRFGTKVAGSTARFAVGALLHEDFRYHPSTSTNFFARLGNAVEYVVVDRSDSGGRRLAVANLAGAVAGAFAPNLWLPDGFNNARHGETRSLSRLGGLAISATFREFSPEIFKGFHAVGLPFPRLPIPEWWNKDITVARRPTANP
jgi:hypothetical protein